MLRITAIQPGHSHDATDTVLLDHDQRRRRRIVYRTQAGHAILLDQPNVVHLRHGDGLLLDDGTLVAVEALPERLTAITAPDLPALVRIAWHLGNRHLRTQLDGERLLIREDHVIAHMVEGLGGTCHAIEAAFDPEGGAYEGGHDHGHGHAHDDSDHDHAHRHHHHHSHG
ncbi:MULTISPECIES: urease accessory protein UreE [Sphingobium]|uniref:urease accessory protein UreE n=1 Tax=Sphingobium TaxID=165695 RepID=UPI0015EB9DD2|nr:MULTISPECIES: urease accessory protein UreE [Sphingobium]MCW2363796.1 urease accessory protein [Sphingobium sp. B10D3B]MCW2402806.1 urease accessory protein [Sphingobium sp. B10D7B]MCW2409784.1 urease accessory protein [Sphingobium xanthum]